MKYDREELEILEAIESNSIERVPFDSERLSKMAEETLDYLNEKNRSVSISRKAISTTSKQKPERSAYLIKISFKHWFITMPPIK